jgi:hypothetical protein
LSFSTNELKVKSIEKFYFGMDLSGRYYFDNYIFKNKDIETYAGLGLGRFYLENNGNTTFNMSLGGRYWFSKIFAISLQGIGKAALKPVNKDVLSYYEYNFGIVWRTTFKKETHQPKITNSQLNFLEEEKVIDRIAQKVADKIKEKTVEETIIKQVDNVIAAQSVVENSENMKPAAMSTNPLHKSFSKSDFRGDWYIEIREKEGSKIFNYVIHSISFPYLNDNTIWISDNKKGNWLKCKIKVNETDGTFSATAVPNFLDDGTVTITDGKIEKRAALSKSGHMVDKISFNVIFSYDPNHVLLFVGHKSTGQKEDEY